MSIKTRIILIILLLGNVVSVSVALKTDKVEFGIGGSYDGSVYIQRSETGELVFKDTSLTSPVVLSTLSKKAGYHSDLLGLLADDHPQYLTTSRHQQAHDATFNDSLPISGDVNGNTLMKDHFQDADIHLNRTQAEQVQGRWQFANGLDSTGDITINPNAQGQSPAVVFHSGENEARIEWNPGNGKIEFSTPIQAQQAELDALSSIALKINEEIDGSDEQGEPSAVLEKFARINGIKGSNLIDKSADEDITGQWDFMKKIKVFQTVTGLTSLDWALSGILTTELESDEAINGLSRIGANISSSFSSTGTGEVNNSKNVGVISEAYSMGKSEYGESMNNIGVVGKAYSESHNSNVIGVAGIASAYSSNRSRIGLYGGLSTEFLDIPTSVPTGVWAGYFDGDVGINGSLLVNNKEVSLKNSNVVTVGKDGADFTSIQSAIDSITDSSAMKPYVVLVYPGVYEEAITIPVSKDYISLIGVERESCIISRANPVSGAMQIGDATVNIGGEHCALMNLTIKNTANAPNATPSLLVYSNASLYITNCHFTGGGRDIVSLWNTSNSYFYKCRIDNTEDASHVIWFNGGTGVFLWCDIRAPQGTTIQWTTTSKGTFAHCYLEGDAYIFDMASSGATLNLGVNTTVYTTSLFLNKLGTLNVLKTNDVNFAGDVSITGQATIDVGDD
ncbi:hypothetical protein J7M23_00810, partial [Candidatus Sumerlaeota bacterium]|nr:hypothetical protein [Candidatus Sumerlaeota bacterium]